MNGIYVPGPFGLPWVLPSLMGGLMTEDTRGPGRGSFRSGDSHRHPPTPPSREKTVLQSTNRKLERRVKELSIQIDDERQHVNDQKDQVRVAAVQPCGRHTPSTCWKAGETHVIGRPNSD